jgi:uncharacterized membrane protein
METKSKHSGPAASYAHHHPPISNINVLYEEQATIGHRVADRVTSVVGSWPFVIIQSLCLVLWMGVNVYLATMASFHPDYFKAWDPYPFILLNLVLSFQAAYTGPVVLMSQNRQAIKDRLAAEQDFRVNLKTEEEVAVIIQQLVHYERLMVQMMDKIEAMERGGASGSAAVDADKKSQPEG